MNFVVVQVYESGYERVLARFETEEEAIEYRRQRYYEYMGTETLEIYPC